MFALTNKPAIGARLSTGLIAMATDADRGVDLMRVVQYMAGVLVETYLVFEDPDEALNAGFTKLCAMLEAEPVLGELGLNSLPPAHIIDAETEKGREAARDLFEDWMDCEYEFHDLIITIMHDMIISWEPYGQSRQETLRILIECALRAMAFEIAAQELCDVMIDRQIGAQNWSIIDCVAGLSAVAGVRLALSLDYEYSAAYASHKSPSHLDRLAFVMTAEAVRLGVPAGSDWRFGVPANDAPTNAPHDLIASLEPTCTGFFEVINLVCEYDQAVACAKAAGRMLAVAAGGERPEIEPVIAKPLAMSAITESYKSVCTEHRMISY